MSQHSYSRCWLHLIWGTKNHEKLLTEPARKAVSKYLYEYVQSKNIYLKINYVNADHVHTLLDLPTGLTIEEVAQLLKGSSSHWINQQNLTVGKFSWGRGYGAFSVSQSNVDRVANYIAEQAEHHRRKTFRDEYERFISSYGLQYVE